MQNLTSHKSAISAAQMHSRRSVVADKIDRDGETTSTKIEVVCSNTQFSLRKRQVSSSSRWLLRGRRLDSTIKRPAEKSIP